MTSENARNNDTTGGDKTEAEQDETVRLDSGDADAVIPAKLAVSIIIRSGPKKGAEYSLTRGRTVIGRGTGADIILEDRAVSRMHASIEYIKPNFVLKDLGSMNGTRMEGKSVKETELTRGDKFQVGDTVIEFVLMDKPGESVYVIE